MTWFGYIGIENVNLSNAQKQTLIGEIERLGPGDHPQPSHLCHWRTRLDNDAAIYHALFDIANLTVAKMKARLGVIFNVDPQTIDHNVVETDFAGVLTQVITFSRAGTNYVRFALFGGINSIYENSHAEVLGYLSANINQWQEQE